MHPYRTQIGRKRNLMSMLDQTMTNMRIISFNLFSLSDFEHIGEKY
jgi:hypothetical protein